MVKYWRFIGDLLEIILQNNKKTLDKSYKVVYNNVYKLERRQEVKRKKPKKKENTKHADKLTLFASIASILSLLIQLIQIILKR